MSISYESLPDCIAAGCGYGMCGQPYLVRVRPFRIATNVERVAQMTEESSAAVSEVSSAAVKLEKLAEELQRQRDFYTELPVTAT